MCGICGKYNFGSKKGVEQNLIEAMTDILEHRGPDDRGFYFGQGIGLGHRRLSILDLSSAGHQPMFNEDNTVCVVFNGEIYNYKSLRDGLKRRGHRFRSSCDTEVIVHAYEEYGEDCVNYLSGMFAFGVWDARRKILLLARDRLGVKPLYYYKNDRFITFASEIKSVLVDAEVPKDVDAQSLSNFLTLHYVPGPRTMFEHVEKLQPGHMLVFRDGTSRLKRFWELRKNLAIVNSLEKAKEEEVSNRIYSALSSSVQARLQSDVKVGALLSGGLDSSAILGLMTRLSGKPVPSFTVGYSEQGDDDISEFKYSRTAAKYFKSDPHEVVVTARMFNEFLPRAIWHQDEPIGEPASVPLYYASKLARDEGVTVLLTGEGSDELFAGYNRHWGEMLSRYYRLIPAFIRDSVMSSLIQMIPKAPLLKKGHRSMSIKDFKDRYMSWHTVFADDLKRSLMNPQSSLKDTYSDVFEPYRSKVDGLKNLDKILMLDLLVWLPDDLLMKKDKMGMATSIEARVPFLDYSFVEFAFQLPERYKVKRLETKYILKKAMERLLPKEIIYRKKEGFPTPISRWIREDLRTFVMDLLCSDNAMRHGYFNRKSVERIVADHMSGRQDNSRLIFPLINFEIWHSLFFTFSSPRVQS